MKSMSDIVRSQSPGASLQCEERALSFFRKRGDGAIVSRLSGGEVTKIVAKDRPAIVRRAIEKVTRPFYEWEDSTNVSNCRQCKSGKYPKPPGRACSNCCGLQDLRSADASIVDRTFASYVAFDEAKPWLTLRLNHVMRVECPWSTEYKYVNVIGGGGNCDPGMWIVRNLEDIDDERAPENKAKRRVVGLNAWTQSGTESQYSWRTLDYLQARGRGVVCFCFFFHPSPPHTCAQRFIITSLYFAQLCSTSPEQPGGQPSEFAF